MYYPIIIESLHFNIAKLHLLDCPIVWRRHINIVPLHHGYRPEYNLRTVGGPSWREHPRGPSAQREVARQANIDRTTVGRIESGEGGSISSLVQIARVLGREDWLSSFAPAVSAISPMERLRDQQRGEDRQRRRASKRPNSS